MASRVTVHQNTISRFIRVGDGNRWLRKKANEVKAVATSIAPRGATGRLAESHVVEQSRDVLGRYQTGFNVENTAPYARFVHEGTGLYGPRGRMIVYGKKVGPIPTERGNIYIWSQAGQRPQPWLRTAAEIVFDRI